MQISILGKVHVTRGDTIVIILLTALQFMSDSPRTRPSFSYSLPTVSENLSVIFI
jgi:hypothetical protein